MALGWVLRRFRIPLLLIVAILLYGTIGYWVIVDGADPVDGLYWTVLTLGGVGFRDTETLGPDAEIYSITLITGLLVAVGIGAAILSELLSSGELSRVIGGAKMERTLARMSGHFIICGYGRVGRAVADEYRARGLPFVVVEIDPRCAGELTDHGAPHLIADPQHDEVLEQAGVTRARGLVCAVDSDAVNVFIALSARALNPDVLIVARATDPATVGKLKRVGASRVISPYALSGRWMALEALDMHQAAIQSAIAEAGDGVLDGAPAPSHGVRPAEA